MRVNLQQEMIRGTKLPVKVLHLVVTSKTISSKIFVPPQFMHLLHIELIVKETVVAQSVNNPQGMMFSPHSKPFAPYKIQNPRNAPYMHHTSCTIYTPYNKAPYMHRTNR